jgi:replication initiation and membrane attachment protein DnaB
MTKKQIEKYIRVDLDSTPRHNCAALSSAINEVAKEVEHDSYDLMELLLSNKPIDSLHTHSYGFHTSNGRGLIESMQNAYNTYTS